MSNGSLPPVYEEPWWQQGKFVAGVDEVGRGAIAGPVVAAAVVLPIGGIPAVPVRDSKQLSPTQRRHSAAYLQQYAHAYALGWVEAAIVDTFGIRTAVLMAMEQALSRLPLSPAYIFVDGLDFPSVELPGIAIVDGDRKCLSIAAASILAKVARDTWMEEVADLRYPAYGFARHKGYGTPQHWQALHTYGPCALHRRSFLRRLEQWLEVS